MVRIQFLNLGIGGSIPYRLLSTNAAAAKVAAFVLKAGGEGGKSFKFYLSQMKPLRRSVPWGRGPSLTLPREEALPNPPQGAVRLARWGNS
jgi:hypothetical protein